MENQQPSELPEQHDQNPQPGELGYRQPLEQDMPLPPEDVNSEPRHTEHSPDSDDQQSAEDYGLDSNNDQSSLGDALTSIPIQVETEAGMPIEHDTPESPAPNESESANVTDDHWAEFVAQHPQDEPKRSPDEIMKLVIDGSNHDKIFTAKETEDFVRRSLDGPLLFDASDDIHEKMNSAEGREKTKSEAIRQWGDRVVEALGEDFFNREMPPPSRDLLKGWFIGEAVRYSEKGISPDMAVLLAQEGLGGIVGDYIDKFTGLDADVANRLINAGDGDLVIDYFDSFDGLDESHANDALLKVLYSDEISGDWIDWFIDNKLSNFKGLSNEVATRLTEADGAWWISHLTAEELTETFPDLDQKYVAEHIIQGLGGYYEFEYAVEWLSKLKNVDSKTMMDKIIEHRAGYVLIARPELFPNVNQHEVLDLMIETRDHMGIGELVDDGKFEGINSADFAERLVEAKMLRVVAENLDKFPELHPDIAYDLIHAGYVDKVASNIDKFPNLSQQTLRRIIKYTKSESKK